MQVHPDQLSISSYTVSTLIAAQFPQWAGLPVQEVASVGTVNAIYRIGRDVVARFPLLPTGDVDALKEELHKEAAAAEELGAHSPFPVPKPLGIGAPGGGYPMPWTVYSWIPGDTATADNDSESDSFATDLGDFLHAVRAVDTRGRSYDGNGRGGELRSHDEWVQECLAHCAGLAHVPTLRSIWEEMRELPRGDVPDVMSHGDLIPPNILATDGRLTGVLDVGGFRAADPALDLVCAWHLFDAPRRARLRIHLGCDEAEWRRGRAWAFEQAIGALWYYVETNPVMSQNCHRTLERILSDT